MSSIRATLNLFKLAIPDGVVPGAFEVTLIRDGVAGTPVTTTEASITFEDLGPGTYTATARRLSSDGAGVPAWASTAASDPVVIEPPTGNDADVPSTITLALV